MNSFESASNNTQNSTVQTADFRINTQLEQSFGMDTQLNGSSPTRRVKNMLNSALR